MSVLCTSFVKWSPVCVGSWRGRRCSVQRHGSQVRWRYVRALDCGENGMCADRSDRFQ